MQEKVILLPSIAPSNQIELLLEKRVSTLFKQEIYLPLLRDLLPHDETKVVLNSTGALERAIISGQLVFMRGKFVGKLNAKLSLELRKLGAVYDRKQGCYKINRAKLPANILTAISTSVVKFEETLKKVQHHLDQLSPDAIAGKLNADDIFSKQIYSIEKEISRQIKNISVFQSYTDEQVAKIAQQYTNNMQLDIKGWSQEEIVKLRKQVQKNFDDGLRYEGMIDSISRRYQVSKNKAKFLARQESNLLSSNVQESRYRAVGSEEYQWQCVRGSPKHPVRPMHKRLDRTIHRWDNPPIVNDKGDRKNPGCDYNCRCRARAILRFKQG